jgi:hypothetical protein
MLQTRHRLAKVHKVAPGAVRNEMVTLGREGFDHFLDRLGVPLTPEERDALHRDYVSLQAMLKRLRAAGGAEDVALATLFAPSRVSGE